MGHQTDEIARQISHQRHDLDHNLHALRDRAQRAVDWRAHWEQRPLALMGIAFGGGVLLSLLTGPRRRVASSGPDSPPALLSPEMATASRRWDNLRGALLGVAASKLTEAMERVLPGFEEEFKKTAGSEALPERGSDR